eukprot:5657005-Pyramimonas_sp.AAC.2
MAVLQVFGQFAPDAHRPATSFASLQGNGCEKISNGRLLGDVDHTPTGAPRRLPRPIAPHKYWPRIFASDMTARPLPGLAPRRVACATVLAVLAG